MKNELTILLTFFSVCTHDPFSHLTYDGQTRFQKKILVGAFWRFGVLEEAPEGFAGFFYKKKEKVRG